MTAETISAGWLMFTAGLIVGGIATIGWCRSRWSESKAVEAERIVSSPQADHHWSDSFGDDALSLAANDALARVEAVVFEPRRLRSVPVQRDRRRS